MSSSIYNSKCSNRLKKQVTIVTRPIRPQMFSIMVNAGIPLINWNVCSRWNGKSLTSILVGYIYASHDQLEGAKGIRRSPKMCQGERERRATIILSFYHLAFAISAKMWMQKSFQHLRSPNGGAEWRWIQWYNPWKITQKKNTSKQIYYNPWSLTPSPLKHDGTGVYTSPDSFFWGV